MNTLLSQTGLKPGDRLIFRPGSHSIVRFIITRNGEPLIRRTEEKDWIFPKMGIYVMSRMADVIGEISKLKPKLFDKGTKFGIDYAVFILEDNN